MKKRSSPEDQLSDSNNSVDSPHPKPVIDISDSSDSEEHKKPSLKKSTMKTPLPKRKKGDESEDTSDESYVEKPRKKTPPKKMSSAKTSTAKKPSKAPPAKKTKLAEKSHEEPMVDSSNESSVAQTKKVTPPKKTPSGKSSTVKKPSKALMGLTPDEQFALFMVQSSVKPSLPAIRSFCTDPDFKKKVASEYEDVRKIGEKLLKQIELMNTLHGFNENACAAVKKDHENTLKAIASEMTQIIASQEEALKSCQAEAGSKEALVDEEGTGPDWTGWHYTSRLSQHQDRIPDFYLPLFSNADERKKMAPLKKIQAFQKQASKDIFSGINMFWPQDRIYEPVSTRAQEVKFVKHMLRFENLCTKTKKNKSYDDIVYPFDRRCDDSDDIASAVNENDGPKQVNEIFFDYHKKTFLFRTMRRPMFHASFVNTRRLDFISVRDYMAITVNCVQSEPETTNMPYAIISFIRPPLNKMKAFPSCAKHTNGCGRSTEIGDLVRIDGYETISVNKWLLCVAAKKIVPSAANKKDSVDLGCTVGYVKVIFILNIILL